MPANELLLLEAGRLAWNFELVSLIIIGEICSDDVGNIFGNYFSIKVKKYALCFEIAQLQYKVQLGVELPIFVNEVKFITCEFEKIFPVFLGQS